MLLPGDITSQVRYRNKEIIALFTKFNTNSIYRQIKSAKMTGLTYIYETSLGEVLTKQNPGEQPSRGLPILT